MSSNAIIRFFDDKNKWLVLFVVTYLAAFYWLPDEVPLFYSQALPEERLAGKYFLLILPAFIYIFFILSHTLLKRLALQNKHMLTLIQFFRLGLAALCYLIFVKIILLVI